MAVISQPRIWKRGPTESKNRTLISPVELRNPKIKAIYYLIFLFLVAFSLTMVFPLYWLFTGPMKSPVEFLQVPPTWFPKHFSLDNYIAAWQQFNFVKYFANTMVIAAGSWVTGMLVTVTAAYSLSKLRPAFGNFILFLFFSTIMVPGAMLLVPLYLTVAKVPIIHVSLLQTYWAIWLPGATNGFGIFMMKLFFDAIPKDLTDAANLDGANSIQSLIWVVLPMAKAAIIVMTIGAIMGSWNDFFWPFLVLTGAEDKWPIMVALFTFSGGPGGGGALDMTIAADAIAAIPPLVLFFFLQRHILQSINLTGLMQS